MFWPIIPHNLSTSVHWYTSVPNKAPCFEQVAALALRGSRRLIWTSELISNVINRIFDDHDAYHYHQERAGFPAERKAHPSHDRQNN